MNNSLNFTMLLLLTLLSFTITQCRTVKEGDLAGIDSYKDEDGICYEKCYIIYDDQIESPSHEDYAVFTGNPDEEDVVLDTIDIEVAPKSTKWIKKKADKGCRSADPNDCLVWCLVELPEQVKKLTIVVDTTQTNNFVMERVSVDIPPKRRNQYELRQVVCQENVTRELVADVQDYLLNHAYYKGQVSQVFDKRTKKALKAFQRDNDLPIGKLDFETLDVIGVVLE